MIKKIITTTIISLFAANTLSAKAKIPVCFPCETIETIEELPTSSEIHKIVGEKVNLSYMNNEYGALGLVVWNADGRFVLSDISNNTYREIDNELAEILKSKHDFDVNTEVYPMSFWKKKGGKIIFALLILLGIWAMIPSKK